MSDFTHKNLRDVADSAPQFGFAETQSARFASETMEAEETGLSLHTTTFTVKIRPKFKSKLRRAKAFTMFIDFDFEDAANRTTTKSYKIAVIP